MVKMEKNDGELGWGIDRPICAQLYNDEMGPITNLLKYRKKG